MEGQNIDAIENVDLRENSHYDFHENDSGFIYEVSEMAQKKKSTMKTFCEQTNIEDEKCEEIAEYGRIHKEANTFNSTSMMTFEKIKADE